MAIFRKIHTSFWSDSFTSELDKEKKLFYLYLLTNERTRQCGVYEITKRQISFDLGCSIDTVSKLLEYFIKKGKIKYNNSTNELAIGNWLKYNGSTSPKVKSCIDKEFKLVKDTVLIEYVNNIDTHPQEEEEEEEEEEKNNKKETVFSFQDFWSVYPVKKGKSESEKKYNKLKEEDRLIIKNTIKNFINDKPFKDYTHPHPLTYINQKRWLDNVDVKKEIPPFEFDFEKHGGDMNLFEKLKREHELKYS